MNGKKVLGIIFANIHEGTLDSLTASARWAPFRFAQDTDLSISRFQTWLRAE